MVGPSLSRKFTHIIVVAILLVLISLGVDFFLVGDALTEVVFRVE